MRTAKMTGLAVAAMVLLGGLAQALEVYVSTTGSDTTGDGSAGNPWATIGKGLTGRVAGDIVHVAAGNYSGGVLPAPSGISLIGAGSGTTSYTWNSGFATTMMNMSVHPTSLNLIKGLTFTQTHDSGAYSALLGYTGGSLTGAVSLNDVTIRDINSSGWTSELGYRLFNLNNCDAASFEMTNVNILNNDIPNVFRIRNPSGLALGQPMPLSITGGLWDGNTLNAVADWNTSHITGTRDLVMDGLIYTNNNLSLSLAGTRFGTTTIDNVVFSGNNGVGLGLGTIHTDGLLSLTDSVFASTVPGGTFTQATGVSMTGVPTEPVTIMDSMFIGLGTGALGGGATPAWNYWATNLFSGTIVPYSGFVTLEPPVVPEPTTVGLLALGGLLAAVRRRRR